MNFDRKSGNSNGEPAEGSAAFPELSPVFDERGQGGLPHAPQPHFSGNEYPSGAFPALDVAYSGYNGEPRYNGEPAYGGETEFNNAAGGGYAPADGSYYDAYPQNSYPQNGYEQSAYPQQNEAYSEPQNSAYYDGEGGQPMTARRYAEQEDSAPLDAEGYYHDEPQFHAEEAFHSDLSGESLLQPAQFEPSDYDYAYDPEAEREAAARQAAEAEQRQASYQQQYQPQPSAYAPAGGQGFAQGYSLQSAAYKDGAGAYGQAAEGGYYGQAEQDYAHDGDGALPADMSGYGTAEEPILPQGEAPLPFADDEGFEENMAADGNLASDLERLDADFAEINRIDSLVENFPPPEQENGIYVPQQAEPQWQGRRGAVPQAHLQQAAAPQAMGRAEASAAAMPYDDGVYDWSAPPVAPLPSRQSRAAKMGGKGKKWLLSAAVLAGLLFIGGGLYWWLSGSRASYGGAPVIIHKAAGDYKVKADTVRANAGDSGEQSVSEGVSGDAAAQSKQKSLIDKSENPLEMEKMNDRLPFSQEGRFDQSSVESLIKSVVAQANPVHIVPTVRVNSDRQITGPAAGAAEKVLLPGRRIIAEPQEKSAAAEAGGRVARSAFAAAMPPPATLAAASEPVSVAAVAAAPMRKAADSAKTRSSAAAGGDFYMQISSQPSRAAAEQSLRAAKKYLTAEAAGKLIIVPAVLPEKGTYYRVRITGQSREEAEALCDSYKQAGGHCFIAR